GHFYAAGSCGTRGHGYKLHMAADEVVRNAVIRQFTPAAIRKELDMIQRKSGVTAQQATQLQSTIEDLETKAEWATERAFAFHKSGDTRKEAKWIKRQDEWEA